METTTKMSNELWLKLSSIAEICFEVLKYKILYRKVENIFIKRSNRFDVHTLADSERLTKMTFFFNIKSQETFGALLLGKSIITDP